MSGSSPINLAIFASGRGSNATAIVEYFRDQDDLNVGLIISNNREAAVLQMAEENGIPTHVTNRAEFKSDKSLLPILREHDIDWIALAGFLWLIPEALVSAYSSKIVNIHPALLPKFGGKGMYGMNVHRAVKAAEENESGITIHLIDEEYDKGEIAFQARVELDPDDSPEDIASKVLQLEHQHFGRVMAALMRGEDPALDNAPKQETES